MLTHCRSAFFVLRASFSATPDRRTGRTYHLEPRRENEKPTILIVDDEPGVRSSLSGVLKDEG